MNRRDSLFRLSALAGSCFSIGASGWATQALASEASTSARTPRLVVVFLRGAVDGLSVVVPYGDPGYYQARSTIALQPPGQEGGVLDLDGHFGLHPALDPLQSLWQRKQLAFVHASGSPDLTRSHFDAQDYMESATPGRKSTADGWMNRSLAHVPGPRSATRALSLGPVMPRIFAGAQSVANVPLGSQAGKPTAIDKPAVAKGFEALYGGDDKMARAFQESQMARKDIRDRLSDEGQSREMLAASNGAPLPTGFPEDAARLAQLMRAQEAPVQMAFLALGGWDTHANQGAATGQLAGRLKPLGQGLAVLAERLGPVWDDTVVMVMSEFGRTVRQNGNGGTDHGHGNVMWLMGGAVQGGRVYGRWPGLSASALHEGRDLAVTTDFRQVVAEVLSGHLRLPAGRLPEVLPGWPGAAPQQALGLVRA